MKWLDSSDKYGGSGANADPQFLSLACRLLWMWLNPFDLIIGTFRLEGDSHISPLSKHIPSTQ